MWMNSIYEMEYVKEDGVWNIFGIRWNLNYTAPGGMCGLAFNAIYPVALALQYGATFPWQEDPDVIQLSCPDTEVNNCFELRRRPRP